MNYFLQNIDALLWVVSLFLLLLLPIVFKLKIIPSIELKIGDIYQYLSPAELIMVNFPPGGGYIRKPFKISFHFSKILIARLFSSKESAGCLKYCPLCKAGLKLKDVSRFTVLMSVIYFIASITLFATTFI